MRSFFLATPPAWRLARVAAGAWLSGAIALAWLGPGLVDRYHSDAWGGAFNLAMSDFLCGRIMPCASVVMAGVTLFQGRRGTKPDTQRDYCAS